MAPRQGMQTSSLTYSLINSRQNQSEGAEEKFQKIGEAYAILKEPQERAWYDKNGKKEAGAVNAENVDPEALFGQMFGGEAFKDYVSLLSVAFTIL